MDWISGLPGYFKYLITAIGSLLAILGLFVDRKSPYFTFIAPLFIGLVCLLGLFQAVESRQSDQSSALAQHQREQLLILVDNTSVASLKTSAYLTDILLSQPKILKDFGLSVVRAGKPLDEISTSELVESEILAANKYRMELIAEKPPSQRLTTRVWYYNKEVDAPELRNALSEIGFTVVNQVAHQNQANDPTNAVWHGPEVDFEDYKAVIVSLIRAGIDIRRTGPSCRNLENKVGVIEIGSSDLASGLIDGLVKPTKSIETIRNARGYDDLDDFQCDD